MILYRSGLVVLALLCLMPVAVMAQPTPLSGVWVGGVVIDGQWTFLTLDFAQGVAVYLGQLCGVNQTRLGDQVSIQIGGLSLAGTLENGYLTGQAELDGADGFTFLAQTAEIPPWEFDAYVGNYQISPAERWLVTRTDAAQQLFFQAGDQQILLFPLTDGRFLSQRGEWIAFHRDEHDQVVGFSIRRMYAPELSAELFASRVALYAEQPAQFGDDDALLGTLLLPLSKGPYPGIILIHGAGASERQYYRVFADQFAQQGIAALIYDKRDTDTSVGGDVPFDVLVADAQAGVEWLSEQPDIDPARIGVWGISQGGRVAPVVAAQSDRVAFVIAVSAPGMPPSALWLWHYDQESEYPHDVDGYAASLERFRLGWSQLTNKNLYPEISPAAAWSLVSQPVLFVYGLQDRVIPVSDSIACIVQALEQNDTDYALSVFESADHNLFVVGDEGVVVAPGVLSTMSEWIIEPQTDPESSISLTSTLLSSGDFEPWGRYGARRLAVWTLFRLVALGGCALALLYAAIRCLCCSCEPARPVVKVLFLISNVLDVCILFCLVLMVFSADFWPAGLSFSRVFAALQVAAWIALGEGTAWLAWVICTYRAGKRLDRLQYGVYFAGIVVQVLLMIEWRLLTWPF